MINHRIVLSLAISIALLGACAVETDAFDRPNAERVIVTLEELTKAYEANEASAQATYDGHLLEVGAEVESVKLNRDDHPFVNLKGGALLPAQLSFEKSYSSDAAALTAGQHVTFECLDVSEMLGTPMLSECRVKR